MFSHHPASAAVHRPRVPATGEARRAPGWTLIELMIALALAGLLLTLGVPAWGDWIGAAQLAGQAQLLASDLALARSEAIKRGRRVTLCRSTDGQRCADTGGWESGWLTYVDADGSGRPASGDAVLYRTPSATTGVTVRGNRPIEAYVSFLASGHARLLSGGLQMGTFTVCRPGLDAHKVVLANSGRVRVEKTHDRCTP